VLSHASFRRGAQQHWIQCRCCAPNSDSTAIYSIHLAEHQKAASRFRPLASSAPSLSHISEQQIGQSIGSVLENVLADIDYFKRVNDQHGHAAGDRVLAEVAKRFQHVVAGKGEVYRYGGEEILFILPNHSIEEAIAVAERARLTIETEPVNTISVTASFGVSAFPDHGGDSATLFDRADKALYDAKNRGRNLVRLFGDPEPTEQRRVPKRKQATAGRWTEVQKVEIRKQYFQTGIARCPDDSAILRVIDMTTHGSLGRDINVSCPMCGGGETLLGGTR
jgi:diguanylate cyclase (GGDEF)-like protein